MFKKIIVNFVLAAVFFSFFTGISYAAVGIPSELYPQGAPTISGKAPGTDNDTDWNVEKSREALTKKILNVVFSVAGVVAVFFIINNAWWMIASGGSEEVITQRKKGLTWAVVGLILIIFSYSIIRFVITMTFQAHQGP